MQIITRQEAIKKGFIRYFTGNPCKYGHVSERNTKQAYCIECHDINNKNYKRKDYCEEFRIKNQKKIKVKTKVARAIRTGVLIRKKCAICGKEKTDAHHKDYSKPLDVIWLCRTHHSHIHMGLIKV